MGAILPGDGKGTLFAAAHFVRFWHKAVMAIISSVMSAFGKADIRRTSLNISAMKQIAHQLQQETTRVLTSLRKERLNMCGLSDDDRQIQSAFQFAHFRAAKVFTPFAASRAQAQRPSQSHQ